MIKREELSNPQSCMSRAKEDEMTFVLLGRDAAAPAAIRAWIKERVRLGKNREGDAQIVEARECADGIQGANSPSGAQIGQKLYTEQELQAAVATGLERAVCMCEKAALENKNGKKGRDYEVRLELDAAQAEASSLASKIRALIPEPASKALAEHDLKIEETGVLKGQHMIRDLIRAQIPYFEDNKVTMSIARFATEVRNEMAEKFQEYVREKVDAETQNHVRLVDSILATAEAQKNLAVAAAEEATDRWWLEQIEWWADMTCRHDPRCECQYCQKLRYARNHISVGALARHTDLAVAEARRDCVRELRDDWWASKRPINPFIVERLSQLQAAVDAAKAVS